MKFYNTKNLVALGAAAAVFATTPVFGAVKNFQSADGWGNAPVKVEEVVPVTQPKPDVEKSTIKQQDTRPKTPAKKVTPTVKPKKHATTKTSTATKVSTLTAAQRCAASPVDVWSGKGVPTLNNPECNNGPKSQLGRTRDWLKQNYGITPISVFNETTNKYILGSDNNGVSAFGSNGKINRTLVDALRDVTGSGDGRINNRVDKYTVKTFSDSIKSEKVQSQTIADDSISKIIKLPSGIYMFADNANSVLDAFALDKDEVGNYTGLTNAVYDGDINNPQKINTKEHLKRIRAGFDNAGFFQDRDSRYMGLVHVLNDKTTGFNGAEGLLRYIAEAQKVIPMSVTDLSTFVDVVAYNDYMDDLMSTHMDDKDNLVMNEKKKLELIEKYRKLGVSSGVLDKITTITSPVGILSYIANGFSFDKSNNLTGHGSVNYMPNQLVIKKAIANGSFDSETLLDRFGQNKLTYEANLGEVNRK